MQVTVERPAVHQRTHRRPISWQGLPRPARPRPHEPPSRRRPFRILRLRQGAEAWQPLPTQLHQPQPPSLDAPTTSPHSLSVLAATDAKLLLQEQLVRMHCGPPRPSSLPAGIATMVHQHNPLVARCPRREWPSPPPEHHPTADVWINIYLNMHMCM